VEPVFVEKVEDLAAALRDLLRPNDLLVTMGAGNMNAVSHVLPTQLARLAPVPSTRRRSS
jgi:UDP-N-acetylmuramate--alanine ligase